VVDIEQFAFAVQDVERILNGDIQHVGVFHRICGEESEASDVMQQAGRISLDLAFIKQAVASSCENIPQARLWLQQRRSKGAFIADFT